jgi:DNA repair exonuclease SbcCD ATPase subunit
MSEHEGRGISPGEREDIERRLREIRREEAELQERLDRMRELPPRDDGEGAYLAGISGL